MLSHKKIMGITLAIGIMLASNNTEAAYVWNNETEINKVISGEASAVYKEKAAAMRSAEAVLNQEIPLITDKKAVPPSGDKRDYVSLAVYWWPDPNAKDGLPYIRRDGKTNPEKGDVDKYDGRRFEKMAYQVRTLALGYKLSGDERFAARAVEIMSAWFINPTTRMNPNLNYAQYVPGRNDGRKSGIIDTVKLIEMIDSIKMLDRSAAMTDGKRQAVKLWYGEYLNWLLTSDSGKEEGRSNNNHGTWYDAQVAAFAHFAGNDKAAKEVINNVMTKRVACQIMPDGSMPLELARTRPMNYVSFNLRAFLTLAATADELGINLYDAQTADGRSIKKALDWFVPYMMNEQRMAKPDAQEFKPGAFIQILSAANQHYKNSRYEAVINSKNK